MIMIIAIIYIFYLMRYLINSWKLLSENLQLPAPPKIPLPPILLTPPPPPFKKKIQKLQVPLFLLKLKLF